MCWAGPGRAWFCGPDLNSNPYTWTGSNRRGPGVLLRQQSTFPAPSRNECLVGTKTMWVVFWDRPDRGTTAERDIPIGYCMAFPPFPPCPRGSQYTMDDFRDLFPLYAPLVCTYNNNYTQVYCIYYKLTLCWGFAVGISEKCIFQSVNYVIMTERKRQNSYLVVHLQRS